MIKNPRSTRPFPIIGWREWLRLPGLHVDGVKAKIDTGARSSSLHAEEIELVSTRRGRHVRFVVYPEQRSKQRSVSCQAPLLDERWVKSSNGTEQLRPVILTRVEWGEFAWEAEVTLTSRDLMGFRMLLGREALRKRFLVDAGASFLGGRRLPPVRSKAR